jgi:hypothetical protein
MIPEPSCGGRYVLCPDVILMPVADGTARLVNLDGSAFHLSQTAIEMLKGVLQDREEQTVRRVAAEHLTDIAVVESDLSTLLAALRAKGLLRRRDERVIGLRLRTVIALIIKLSGVEDGRVRWQ